MIKRIFYFTEEMLNIPSFLPIENLRSIYKYINSFDQKAKKGHIKSPVFKFELIDKKINFNEAESVFNKILLPYDEVRFEITPDEVEKNDFAYGYNDFFILGSFVVEKGEKVLDALNFYKGYKKIDSKLVNLEKLSKNLFNFCKNHELILFDEQDPFLKEKSVIKFETQTEIENYIKKPWPRS
ncbi:MAG: hypothetical protein AAB373_00315 [Patescibacteria group bacterium]